MKSREKAISLLHTWYHSSCLLLLCLLAVVLSEVPPLTFTKSYFPADNESTPHYPIRLDGENAVQRGRINLLHHSKRKHRWRDLYTVLQCPKDQGDLNRYTGSLSYLDMIPPTDDIVTLVSIYIHTKCIIWIDCQKTLKEWKDSGTPPSTPERRDNTVHLLRIINHDLYVDWPWNGTYYHKLPSFNITHTHGMDPAMIASSRSFALWRALLNVVHDLPDAVFLYDSRAPYFRWNIPFPFFSEYASRGFNQMPWPWASEFIREFEINVKILNQHHPAMLETITDQQYNEFLDIRPWERKESKALLSFKYHIERHYMIEVARMYPQLFEVSINFKENDVVMAMNPTITAVEARPTDAISKEEIEKSFATDPIGASSSVLHFKSTKQVHNGHYKYVVVPKPQENPAGPSHLLHLLAHCNCVIILQESGTIHFFGSRLKAWVHYVPITFTGADLAEKVAWLQKHDDKAKQIAENGHNFGKSHLRLEDYYCYALTAINRISEATKNATTPFYPKKVFDHSLSGTQQFRHRK